MKAKTPRRRVTAKIADDVMCSFDRACCICRCRKRFLQIHHIDGHDTNNDPDNLAVLCLDHHAEATMSPGQARSLSPGQVRRFRDEWLRIVARQRESRDAPPLHTPAEHEDIMAAQACLEVRKLGWMLPGSKWRGTLSLLEKLSFYTNCFRSYAVDEEVMHALDGLLDWAPDGMPSSVASLIAELVPPSDFVGQRAPSQHRVPKRKVKLLSRAVDIGRSIIYDAVKYHRDIKVVARGARIIARSLRYAELNHLRELKREALEVFKELEAVASQSGFEDAHCWLVFQRKDALCTGDSPLPEFPSDVARKT
jgi:hypothetical protein